MAAVERGSTAETLTYFHEVLGIHFGALHERRAALEPPAPVFALEHGLDEVDRKLLHAAVAAAHRERLIARATTRWWLPLVVHAAEVGYVYDGIEYWPLYAANTPGWIDSEHERDRVRDWFSRFSKEYGGAIPQGAWASTFRKIAWPITHAVLPRYLQVQLARLLFDYRSSWPSSLDDPEALGVRLHGWSRHYGERLEKFCQNSALLGHVAVALLLSAEDEASPYIESSTLDRLVDSLNSERQSRRWLQDARKSASTVRTRNFQRPIGETRSTTSDRRVPALTDPRFQLKRQGGVWHAYAVIPDLKPLQNSLPVVYDALRDSRASVAGSREIIRSGALLYALAPVELSTWPSPVEAFLQLKNASQSVNRLIADQCRMTSGPWWVFRRKPGEPAVEVKSKSLRPGGIYCIVGASDLTPPEVGWCDPAEIAVNRVSAYSLHVPRVITEPEIRAMVSAGLSVQTDLSIQPVGVTASNWDGQGAVEWLAGEPALVMIRAEHSPDKCRLTINGDPYYVDWPAGETELFLSLDGLAVGIHEVVVALGDLERDGRSAGGTLIVSIRDPRAPGDGSFAGEGIRLRTSPAQPSLPELWDGRAVLEVDGPAGASADLTITLRHGDGRTLGTPLRRSLELPVSGDDWRRVFPRLRDTDELAHYYDEADVAELTVSRAGLGLAALMCERGYRGLRWVLTRGHNRDYAARLIDRTDGDAVTVDFFPMERPLKAERQPSDQKFASPPRGGLLWAASGDQTAGQIIPPDPNQLLLIGATSPSIPARTKSLSEVRALIAHHRRWSDAELPAHPFGMRDRERVLQTITRAVAVMLAPGRWANFEHQIAGLAAEDVDLDRAQQAVGDTTAHRAAAQAIAWHLWQWNSPEDQVAGFGEAIAELTRSSGMRDIKTGARFLLRLASSPGELLDWNHDEVDQYLRCVLNDPVLIRAARFAFLWSISEVTGGVG